MSKDKFAPGEIAFCWYFRTGDRDINDMELWFCRIHSIGEEYCTVTLYHGGDWTGSNRSAGRVDDVCVADLSKADVQQTKI